MRPVLFRLFGVRIHSYPAMLYIGTVLGILMGYLVSTSADMDSSRVWVAMVVLMIPGLIGARLLYVATHWEVYRAAPRRIWGRSEGGAAMLGGLPLMVLVSIFLLPWLGVPFAEFWDVATFPIFCGMTFARFGCLLEGCCSGRPSESRFAIRLPDHTGVWRRRLPARPVEAALTASILIGALTAWGSRPFAGSIILGAVAAYSLVRVALQPMRLAQEHVGKFNVQRVVAATFGVLALAGFVGGWVRVG